MRRRSIIAYGLLLTVFSGCHPRREPDIGNPAELPGTLSLRVVNRNTLDVIVYILHDATHTRIGLATAATTTDFVLSLRLLGAGREYRLIGEPVGSRLRITTEILRARSDDEVTWSLEDNFARSTVVVR